MTPLLPSLLFGLLVGLGTGILYFVGLWSTVRLLKTTDRPTLLVLTSFTLRTAAALAAFYVGGQGHWTGFLACLVGFLMARFLIVRRIGPAVLLEKEKHGGRLPKAMDG